MLKNEEALNQKKELKNTIINLLTVRGARRDTEVAGAITSDRERGGERRCVLVGLLGLGCKSWIFFKNGYPKVRLCF